MYEYHGGKHHIDDSPCVDNKWSNK